MEYTKPVIVAQNKSQGCFAAGCGAKDTCSASSTSSDGCKACERSK